MNVVLEVKNLHVAVDNKEILKGINVKFYAGKIHAIMGPNGNGKSTLLSAIMGHPRYEITKGDILYKGKSLLDWSVDERSRAGIFLAMQYPQEISGVTNSDFLKAALNARRESAINFYDFFNQLKKQVDNLKMDPKLSHRFLNEGFSGGEKKRNEILQMKLLNPEVALFDEIDSGLDVDALRLVGQQINASIDNKFCGIIISHYQRIFEIVKPDFVHILIDGKIVENGDYSLINKIDSEGYSFLKDLPSNENEVKSRSSVSSLGLCGANVKSSDNKADK